jgi:hypothetical protein
MKHWEKERRGNKGLMPAPPASFSANLCQTRGKARASWPDAASRTATEFFGPEGRPGKREQPEELFSTTRYGLDIKTPQRANNISAGSSLESFFARPQP